ncbi:MAG: LarC family nickel insertion protein [Clostridiales bacterium]|nr:LarC family nickel insertion protein [Clostridiales bacterium]
MGETLYLDCSSGISGDMFVASLLDLGADETVLRKVLSSVPVKGFEVEIKRVKKSGLDACDFLVALDSDHENHDHDMEYLHGRHHEKYSHEEHSHEEHSHEEHHHDGHDHFHGKSGHIHTHAHSEHEHRGLTEVCEIIEASAATEHAKTLAARIFEVLAEAEAKAHGTSPDNVHFHEVGAVDSIADILAAAVCVDDLGIEEIIIPELYEGRGTVRCQHGLLPIPVPAVANIVNKHHIRVHTTDVTGELVTPTGAAIAAALRTGERLPESFYIKRIGLGAGKRDYDTAGIVRAMLIERER